MKSLLRAALLIFSMVIVTFTSTSCKKHKSTSVTPAGGGSGSTTPTIQTGTFTEVASTSSLSSNSVLLIQNTQDTLINGTKFIVPSAAFSGSKSFTVSYAPVTSHKLGANFNPITPMIQVETDLLYADSLISVEIPIKLPAGHFAMGFLYNEVSGKIEGMPLEFLDSNRIVISTRHFATSSVSGIPNPRRSNTNNRGLFLIASMQESALNGQPIVNTGFKVGTDNWEFPNYGSFVAKGGHCTGQCLAAMWYYYEKKLMGAPAAYNQFQMVDKIWQDNSKGYRFSSTVHKDIKWDAYAQSFFADLPISDLNTLRCFAYSMLITGEPQEIGIYGAGGGHSIIAYKVDMGVGEITLSDPNFPTEIRKIVYNSGSNSFAPYNGAQSAGDEPVIYNKIKYFGKSACYDWALMGQRWKEAEEGKSGDVYFPGYKYEYRDADGNWKVLESDLSIDADTIRIRGGLNNQGASPFYPRMTIYDDKGNIKYNINLDTDVLVNLSPGANIYGFYFSAVPPGGANTDLQYVDFKWLTIRNQIPVFIEDNSVLFGSAPNKEFDIWVKHFSKLPVTQCRFEWDFGDGKKQTVTGDTAVKHTYTQNGAYTIKIKVFKTGVTDAISSAERDIVIGESNSFYLNGNFIDLNGLLTVGTYISSNDMTAISVTDQSSKILSISFSAKAPGIYTIGESGTASISYTTGPFTSPEVVWVVQDGTLTVLGYGPVNGKIFGTFSGTLAGVDYRTDPPTELSGTMTNGRFSVYRSVDQ
jgi:hypothetical protein